MNTSSWSLTRRPAMTGKGLAARTAARSTVRFGWARFASRRITRRVFVGLSLGSLTAYLRLHPSAAAADLQPAKGRPEYPTPEVASDWFRIVEYPRNHLNDFCLFRDQRGIWHAIGILGTGTWASETSLFHSTGKHLRERFENHPPLFETMPRWIGGRRSQNAAPQKHAPFVVFHDGLYHLFYRRPSGTILVVRSPDPFRWPDEVELVFEERDARDICIAKMGGTFHMYYCQAAPVDGVMRSCVLLRTSKHLRDWSAASVVCADTSRESRHSTLESPFVVPRPEGFYLLVRNRLLEEDTVTTVSFSKEPARFPGGVHPWFTELKHVHAPEIVEFDGRHYIARVSGPSHANRQAPAIGGWIEAAELRFR